MRGITIAAYMWLEAGFLATALYDGLAGEDFPVVCLDARRLKNATSAMPVKTDRIDARNIAWSSQAGWFRAVHVKTQKTHKLRALLRSRAVLVKTRRTRDGIVRLFSTVLENGVSWISGHQLEREFGPKLEGIGSRVAIGSGRKTVAFGAKQDGGLIVDRQEPLRLTGRPEPAHDLLSPPRVSMRCLSTIIQPIVLAMLDPGSNFRFCGTVRSKLVREDHPRLTPFCEQLPEKAQCSGLVAPGLEQNFENIAVDIDSTPEPRLRAD